MSIIFSIFEMKKVELKVFIIVSVFESEKEELDFIFYSILKLEKKKLAVL